MSFDSRAKLEESITGNPTVRELYSAWEQRLPIADPAAAKKDGASDSTGAKQIAWMQDAAWLIEDFTCAALEKEEFLLVCDCAREALRLWPRAGEDDRLKLLRVRMHYAEARARLGDFGSARSELEPCVADNFEFEVPRSDKTVMLLKLGNILRQEARSSASSAAQRELEWQALDFYKRALASQPGRIKPLSRMASVGFTLSEPDSALRAEARGWAEQVLKGVQEREDDGKLDLRSATMRAEAQAVLGDTDAASASYAALAKIKGATVTKLADIRYWSGFLAEAQGLDRSFFRAAFPPLQLVVFSGHLPDQAGQTPRFPKSAVAAVRETIEGALKAHGIRVGMCSAAAGADLLFLEELRKLDGTAHVVLPWKRDEFRRTVVDPYEPEGTSLWGPMFENTLEQAATVREIGQSFSNESRVGFEYQLEVMTGLALNAARVSRLDVQPMVLWDEKINRGLGGTEAFVDFWRRRFGLEPIILRLPPVAGEAPTVVGGIDGQKPAYNLVGLPDPRCEHAIFRQEVKTMLFADIVGYSKLNENVIPEFVNFFLAKLSRIVSESPYAPLHVNTWGDALYAVFDYAHNAGLFALEFAKLIHEGKSEWESKGLYHEVAGLDGKTEKKALNIRIGLHTGPVFMHYNPVIRQLGFTGVHVSRAARIEPVTTPGEVFASEEFAALSETAAEAARRSGRAGGQEGFVCEYAGSMPLAKGYPGRYRIYRLIPQKAFGIEELAKAIHALFIDARSKEGKLPAENINMRPWDELAPDLKEANYAQAADIPNKLRLLGYELTPAHGLKPSEIVITKDRLETMAIQEHDRWAQERQRQGWTYAPVRDNARKQHPLLVPWEALSEEERQKDRDTVINLPRLVEVAGFRLRKLAAT